MEVGAVKPLLDILESEDYLALVVGTSDGQVFYVITVAPCLGVPSHL
jgi:hypothetical protein